MTSATVQPAKTGPIAEGKVWIDGQVVDAAHARVSVFDRGFLYGDALFETFTSERSRAPHLARLARGCAQLGMALPDGIDGAIDAAASALGGPAWLRVVVTRGGDARTVGILAPRDLPVRLVVMARPLQPVDASVYRDGVTAVQVAAQRPWPEVKSASYLVSVLAKMEAARRGADEALLVDGGLVREGATSNVFVVGADDTLRTPGVGALPGVTRARVLALAAMQGPRVVEADVPAASLARAREIFLTSSVRGIVPVVRLDGQPIGDGRPGPVYRRIAAAYATS